MSDLRADLEAAYEGTLGDASAEAAPPEAAAPVESTPGHTEAAPGAEAVGGTEAAAPGLEAANAAAARARDGRGRFAGKEAAQAAPVAARPAVVPTQKAPAAPGTAAPAPVASAGGEALRAPQSWKPAAREAWAKLPADIQAEVHRREKETAGVLQESAQHRRFAESFQQTVAPYMGAIQAEGGNPMQAIGSLLQTAQALRGPGKVAVVANIIKQFGVPIDALDAALAGQPQSQGQQQQGGYQDPRVDQLFAHLQSVQQQKQQATVQRANNDVQAFSTKAEFLEDVREHMSVLLANAAERGRAMTLEEAYDKACWSDEGIRGILQQRKAAEAANATNASTQRARAASSSVRSQPSTAAPAASSGSIRADLELMQAKLNSR